MFGAVEDQKQKQPHALSATTEGIQYNKLLLCNDRTTSLAVG
jgi:hypothetical protein